ncbi:MAG: peptide-methionine (R)-S-oxide reductase [Pyrinomonadaceae bacterium]|jgi:peptide-methionine (R)-S-oxide reductase|nr:peptide-methionine (R)-S-oxide reductase [Pyrinomonadaceae bacterium]
MNRRYFLSTVGAVAGFAAFSKFTGLAGALLPAGNHDANGIPAVAGNVSTGNAVANANDGTAKAKGIKKVIKTDAEWKQILTPDQYSVAREKGTERPFSSPLNDIHDNGIFECVACGLPVFSSKAKFDSGTGWPSFYEPIDKESVTEVVDKSLFETRTEVLCARCDSHLGHVFEDGPMPTGLRYCMNGVALKFVKS